MAVALSKTGAGAFALAGAALVLIALPAPVALADSTAPVSVSAAGVTLTSVSVELPASDRMFPDGPGAETINNNCLACHSAGMVLYQPAMSRAGWQAEVTKMRSVFKAPVAETDVPAIVDYLARVKGKE